MLRIATYALFVFLSLGILSPSAAQSKGKKAAEADQKEEGVSFSGLTFRHIGPALMSGRIADIAIHPTNQNTWYVATGSGGVWKTENAGTTWRSLFDGQKSFSIGCITLDPQHPGDRLGGHRRERRWSTHQLR